MVEVITQEDSRGFTRRDLEAMPDDGRRYELLDGCLVVTPSPAPRHQVASSRLQQRLTAKCPEHLIVLSAPCDVVIDDGTVLQPDLLVTDRAAAVANEPVNSPVLVVEILSPSTRLLDLHTKRARYEAAGVPSYWVVDPSTSAVTAWELHHGAYVEVAHVEGEQHFGASIPYSMCIVPADLLR